MKRSIHFDASRKVLVSSLCLLGVAGLALADDTTSGHSGLETMEQPEIQHEVNVNPGFIYTGDADFHNGRLGKVNVWRFNVPANYTMKTEAGDLRLGVFYEFSEYDFDQLRVGATPVAHQDFNTLAFDALWKGMINDNWGYFGYGEVALSASTSTGLGNGLTGIGGGGGRYVWSEDLSLGFGLAVATRLERDPTVLPVIALNWQINDRWNLRTLYGATLTYDVSGDKTFLVDLAANYQHREYRIEHDASVADRMITVELGATYRFSPRVAMRGFAGVAAGRNLEVRRNGNQVGDGQNADAAPIVGVRALFRF